MFCKILARTMHLLSAGASFMLRTSAPSTFLLMASIFVLPLSVSPARATMTEVFGGPGGAHFSMACDPGHYLVGFHARAGAWIHGIGLICAPYDARTGKVGSGSRKGYAGSGGGTEQEVYCAPGEPVTGIGLIHTRGSGLRRQYVNSVDMMCQHRRSSTGCISTGENCQFVPERSSGIGVSDMRDYDVLRCPSHELATGIQGRSGVYVDAIGLICATPVATATPVASGSGSQQVEMNVDRPGNDYRNFDLPTASHESCRVACSGDAKCKAYTYVKPGVQGPKARCWLKDNVPATRVSDCCVSGVIKRIKKLGKRKTDPDPNIDYGGAASPSKGTLVK